MPQPADLTLQLLRSIRDEIAGLRKEVREEIGELRKETRLGFADVKEDLRDEYAAQRHAIGDSSEKSPATRTKIVHPLPLSGPQEVKAK